MRGSSLSGTNRLMIRGTNGDISFYIQRTLRKTAIAIGWGWNYVNVFSSFWVYSNILARVYEANICDFGNTNLTFIGINNETLLFCSISE